MEQRIFGGFNNVPMRTAKLKTEFIDVDLVRGELSTINYVLMSALSNDSCNKFFNRLIISQGKTQARIDYRNMVSGEKTCAVTFLQKLVDPANEWKNLRFISTAIWSADNQRYHLHEDRRFQ